MSYIRTLGSLPEGNFKQVSGVVQANGVAEEAEVTRMAKDANKWASKVGRSTVSETGTITSSTAALVGAIARKISGSQAISGYPVLSTVNPSMIFVATHADEYANAFEAFYSKMYPSSGGSWLSDLFNVGKSVVKDYGTGLVKGALPGQQPTPRQIIYQPVSSGPSPLIVIGIAAAAGFVLLKVMNRKA